MAKRVNKDLNIRVSQTGGKKTEKSFSAIESSIKSMVITGLSIAAVKKSLDNTTGAAIRQEEIFRKLQKTVEINGKNWNNVKGELDETFASLQGLTKYGDTQSADMLQTMIQLSSDYEGSLEALPIAMDFASSGLVDMRTASKLMGMALAGNVEMLGRYVPELKTTNSAQLKTMTSAEKAAFAVETLREKFGGMAESELEATRGKLQAVENYLGDIGETIGDKTLPAMNLLLDSTIDFLQELSETTLETTVRQLKEMGIAAEELAGLEQTIRFESAFDTLLDSTEKVRKSLNLVEEEMQDTEFMERSRDIMGELGQTYGKYKIQLDASAVSSKKVKDVMSGLVDEISNLADGSRELTPIESARVGNYRLLIADLSTLLVETKKRESALRALNSLEKENNSSLKKKVEVFDELSIAADPSKHMLPLVRTTKEAIKPFEMFTDNIIGVGDEIVRTTKVQEYYDRVLSVTALDTLPPLTENQKRYALVLGETEFNAQGAANAIRSLGSLLDMENAKLSDYLMGIGGILSMIPGAQPVGGIFSIVGAVGSVVGLSKGGQFTVPPGYPNDSFPMMVESGERVTVETPQQQSSNPSFSNLLEDENTGGGSVTNIYIQGDFVGTKEWVRQNITPNIYQDSQDGYNKIAVK